MSRERLGPALLVALLAAALVVAALVYRARTPDLALEVVRMTRSFDPEARGPRGEAQIRFFVRFDEAHARVALVGRDRELARTLDEDVSLRANEPVTYTWDGSTDDGDPAEPGRYRLAVVLPGEGREMVFPRRIELEDGSG